MRKLIVSFCILLLTGSVLKANNADLFQLDENIIISSFTDLNELESYLEDQENLSLSSMMKMNDPFLSNINLSDELQSAYTNSLLSEDPMGIPSFWWGFGAGCIGMTTGYGFWLGIVGILAVYFITDDKAETKKATWGCVAGSAAGCVGFLILYMLILGASFATYY